jgi:hypothetical protein
MRFSTVALFCVVLAWACVAKADIMSWTCDNDHDGAINCVATGWNYDQAADAYNLTVKGDQFWGPGHMLMDFTTDTAADPTINSIHAITNDTPVAWTGYLATVTIDADTALTSYALSNQAVTLPGDWSATITQPLTYQGIVGGKYEYVGKIDFGAGTPIATGDELDFKYKITFAGATSYHTIEDLTPIPNFVPEPSMLVFLGIGAVGLLGYIKRRRAA